MSYIECRICFVYPSRNMCDAISVDGGSFLENISYANKGFKLSGETYLPEIGDTVVIELGTDSQASIYKYYASRKSTADNLASINTSIGGLIPANELLPGDRVIAGPDGGFLSILRGALTAIGSSPLAQTIYLGVEGLVRTLAQNFELITGSVRIYTISDAGSTLTRACFNSTDICFAKGANDNPNLESENFEYQIDISSSGISLFVGDIDSTTNKRKNNLVVNILKTGDVHAIVGDSIYFNIYASGITQMQMVDSDSKIIYDKSVTASSSGKVLVRETIKGDVIRKVDGNVFEEITGNCNIKSNTHNVSANIVDSSSTLNRQSTSMKIKERNDNQNESVAAK